MNRCINRVLCVATMFSGATIGSETITPASTAGIDRRNLGQKIRPQDDLYRYVNGGWLAATQIPADAVPVSAASQVADKTREQLRAIAHTAPRILP